MLLLAAVLMGVGSVSAAEEVYKTALFGSDYNNKNVSSYTDEWSATNGDFTVSLENFNNNNNGWNYVKCGRKNNVSVATITTAAAIDEAISKVVVTIDAITVSNVNSIMLYTSSDRSTWTVAGSFTQATGEQAVTLSSPNENLYYKVEFDCASGSNNGLVTVSKVEYYYVSGGNPNVPIINASDIDLTYDATSGEIAYSIDNPADGVTLGASTSADWVSNISVTGEKVTFTTTANEGNTDRTATFTLTYTGAQNKTVTVTQGHFVVDYATLPFTFDGGRADIENTDGLTQEGLDSDYGSSPKLKFNRTGDYLILKVNERPGTLAFNIKGNGFSNSTFKVQTSEDGKTYTDLATYTDLTTTIQNESFNNLGENVRYIKWIYTEKVGGNVALGNISLAAYNTDPSITIDSDEFELTAGTEDGYLEVAYSNLTINSASDFSVQFCDAQGNSLASGSEPDWIEAEVTTQQGETGFFVYYLTSANDGAARTAYFKVCSGSTSSNLVTVTQAAYVAPSTGGKYVKVTSTDNITDGIYLIVCEDEGVAFDGSLTTLDAASNTIPVTINNSEIAATAETTAAEFIIDATAGTIQSKSGYYIGQTSDANGLASSDETAYTNTLSIDGGVADIVSSGGAYLRYNATSGQDRFRYFKSATYNNQKAIQLYKKVAVTVTDAGWATYIAEDHVAFPAAVSVYIVTDNTETSVTLTEVLAVEQGTPVIVKAEAGTYALETVAAEECDNVDDNMLVVYDASTGLEEGYNPFVLAKDEIHDACFKQWVGEPADIDGRVVLPLPLDLTTSTTPNGVRTLSIVFGDTTTGIETGGNAVSTMGDGAYTLSGQRVQKPTKGLYIIGGKKVVVK